jgi:hypothetical protein
LGALLGAASKRRGMMNKDIRYIFFFALENSLKTGFQNHQRPKLQIEFESLAGVLTYLQSLGSPGAWASARI